MTYFKQWYEHALCSKKSVKIWFPASGHDSSKARKICTECPVLEECRQHGLDHEEYGIWGGLTAQEREDIRRAKGIHIRPMRSRQQ